MLEYNVELIDESPTNTPRALDDGEIEQLKAACAGDRLISGVKLYKSLTHATLSMAVKFVREFMAEQQR